MRAICAGLDRHLNKEKINFSIIIDRELELANDAFNTHLVKLSCKQGKILSYFIYTVCNRHKAFSHIYNIHVAI